MKRVLLPLGCLVFAGPVAAQLSFTYETDAVLVAAGDFGSADGRRDLVVVDRASGQVSFGRPDINGNLQWSPPEPCGITNVTGLAVDKFAGGTVDLAAITAPGANRITLAGPNAANTQTSFRHIYPNFPSPRTIAPFDPDADGNAELFIAGDRANGTPQRYYYEFRSGLSGASTVLWNSFYTEDTYRAFRYVPKTGTEPRVGEIYGSAFWTERVTNAAISSAFLLEGVPVGVSTLMTYGNFDGSAFAQVILYSPNATTARAAKIIEPSAGSFAFAAATTLTFPKALRQLITIPTASGGARLGVVFADRSGAIYEFDGTTLTLRSNLFGTPFDWLVPLGTDAIAAKSNLGWQRFNTSFNNLNLSPTHAGAYPAVGTKPRTSNVIFFSAEPFVDVAAMPLAQGSVRDWSTGASGGGTAWNISAADFSSGGIGAPSTSAYVPAVAATHALPNQYRANISTRLLESGAGMNVPDVTIYPPSGVYRPEVAGGKPADEFFVSFNPTLPGMNVFYRINGGSWTSYNLNSPPKITGPATVEAYAGNNVSKSPVRSATYTYSAIPVLANGSSPDLDGDGMPDAWEKGFNITDPQADADGDGASNLGEYLSGTDPQDSGQTPPDGDFVLKAQKTGNTMRLSWPVTTAGTLQVSNSLQSGAWSNISSGITVEGSEKVYYVPTGGSNPVRGFYRLTE
ncbi:hypothetical protein [Luteolibacter luteus]|uniref:Uncharacterized protein n=1 Tax=Luteolibacter luteus TaxID=2728835 RepID=A0A858RCN4_9BACT|nr:hypothetical protein [Luteolibacter luteus]QJE94358.1 hypothetical protein HHL09_00675 [Luteolibacter luteus]